MNGTGANVLIKFTGDTKDVDAKMTGLNKTMGSVTKGFIAGSIITKGLSTAFNMVSTSTGNAIKRLDTMNNFPKVMSNLGISAKDSEEAIKKMSDKLTGLPTSIDSAAASVQRFTSKNGDVKKSTDLFLAMNNAILAGGAPAEQQATAMEQLSQAYAKGKPDMMEWRSIQSVMPAQLKQIATQMGYAGGNADKLGEDLRNGKVSMDDFMNAVMDLNKNGGKGFKSFEEQARNSTGGIQTAIANMRTAITRGLANAFDSLDKALQNAGLGGISGVISNIGKGFEKVLKSIVPLIPPMVKFAQVLIKLAPIWAPIVAGLVAYQKAMQLATKVTQLTQGLSNLPGIFGKIGSSAQNGVSGIMNFAKAHKGLSIGIGLAGVAIGGAIALYKKSGGDANKMAKIITQKVNKITVTITQIAQKLPQIISQVLPKILNAITTALPLIINALVTALPIVINALVNALTTVIPILMNAVVQIVTMLANMLPSLIPVLINGALQLILALVKALPKIITSLIKALPRIITSIVTGLIKCIPQLIQGAIQLVLGIVKALPQIIKSLIKQAPYIIKQLAIALVLAAVELVKTGVKLIKQLWNGFKSWIGNFGTNVKNFVKKIPGWLKSGLTKIGEIGLNIVKGIGHGITNGYNWIKNKIKEFVGNVTSFIKKVFKIGSPSRLMADEIGQWIPKGIAVGITANTGAIHKAMSNMQHQMSDAFGLSPTVTGTASTHFSPEVNVTVQNNMKTDPLGQVVNSVKTFSGGAKNDYNYGIGG
jgi:tape measure domain-containing protein